MFITVIFQLPLFAHLLIHAAAEDMAQIPAVPSLTTLAELKLREMPSRGFSVNR